MNRSIVARNLTRAATLQAVVYAGLALFGPCRPAPHAPENPVADRRHVLEWLPLKRRDVIEQVLAGWQVTRRSGTQLGDQCTDDSPGSYIVEYTFRGNPKARGGTIWILYSAAGEQIALRDSDNPSCYFGRPPCRR